MFGINKKDLVAGLKALGRRRCCYTGINCDCKYGVSFPDTGSGEQTGCPEISQATYIISAMTDQEFIEISARAKIILSEWRRDA